MLRSLRSPGRRLCLRSLCSSRDVIVPGGNHHYGSLGGDAVKPASTTAWQAAHNVDVQRVTQQAIIYELSRKTANTIEQVVPWFLENMPESYFQQVPEAFRMDHIKAIAAIKDAQMDLFLNLQSHLPDGRLVLTFVRPSTAPGTLLHMVEQLPWRTNTPDFVPLTRLHVFSTKDDTMSLNMFVYGNAQTKAPRMVDAGSSILEYAKQVQEGLVPDMAPHPLLARGDLIEYLSLCSDNYLRIGSTDPRRFLQQRLLMATVSGTEGTDVSIDPTDDGHYWVDVAVANSLPQVALEHLCRLLFLHHLDVTRARLDIVPDGDNGSVTLLRMLVAPIGNPELSLETLKVELKRAKWLDPATMELVFERYPELGVTRGEVITAMASLMHPVLAKENAVAYSKANILETLTRERFLPHAAAIADLFLDRFRPDDPMSDGEYQTRCQQIREAIDSDVEDTVGVELLYKMMEIVDCTLKTNVYMPDRYALSMRLDPRIMVSPVDPHDKELPYGILFSHGRRFNAFQVRFRDIARGGMRLVTPKSAEQFALESARQYDECYGLAYAQQLKNKDIPEGGSKAVCLIDATGMSVASTDFIKRKSVKAFTDSILDLIVDTEETRDKILDRFGKKEVLYLGPDEQVIPEDINWVIQRAAYRGYGTPAAFMSSKPRAGINHKEYGVTSEGVNVYVDVALRKVLGIDPKKEPFTIKITGGPDGDVAGNELKILIREYGDNAKVVGIADASGCAEDPNGLDHEELSRLVHMGLPIGHFDPSKLSSDGALHSADTPEGVKKRNSMHNRLVADIFVPCGGRPGTIDTTNYKQFLREDGTPSSKLIVEGANLFLTDSARQALFDDAGVVIVKDSSANKGGVITSSYEICAAMLISEEEFFEHKDQIVLEVLEKLRERAQLEAKLLFREFDNQGGSLPEVSRVMSDCINRATDALTEALDSDYEALMPLFRAHLPATLADLSFEHVHERVPEPYIKNAIASCLASKLVYQEGTQFVRSQSNLAAVALEYLKQEGRVAALVEQLERSSDVPEAEKQAMIELLRAGGARTALWVFQ